MSFKKLSRFTTMLGCALLLTFFPTQISAAGDADDPSYTMGAGYEVAVPGYEEEWETYLKAANRKGEEIPEGFKTVSPFNGMTYTHNPRFEGYTLIHGVDVSKYQTNIDWAKAHEAGVDYAIVRCAYRGKEAGTLNTDPYYKQNLENAVKNNVDVGVYIYSQAITVEEAIEEADYLLNLIEGYEVKLPVVLDFEYGGGDSPGRLYEAKLSAREQTDICLAFCERVEEAGYTPMVYANHSMFTRGLYAEEIEAKYLTWLARWSTSDVHDGAPCELEYTHWQYGGDPQKAKVPGINGTVDTNFWYKDLSVSVKNFKVKKQTDTTIKLSWSKIKDADGYQIYQYNPEKKLYVTIAKTKKNEYLVEGLESGTDYTYRVRPYWEIGGTTYKGGKSKDVNTTTLPAQVQNVKLPKRSSSTLELQWELTNGATGYNIYQLDTNTQEYTKIATVSAEQSSYVVENLKSATEYTFKVEAYRTFNEKDYVGTASEAVSNITSPSQVAGVSLVKRGTQYVTLEWNKVEGASGYYVYKKDVQTGKYVLAYKIGSGEECTVKDSNLTSGEEHSYKIRAYVDYNGSRGYGKYSEVFSTVTKPKKVSSITVTNRTASKLQYSWDTVHGATHYAIYLYSEAQDKFVKIATIPATESTYTMDKLTAVSEYRIKVRPIIEYSGKNIYGSYSSEMKTITNPAKVKGVAVTAKSSSSVNVTWSKSQGASGYYVYRYNEKTKKYVKIATLAGEENVTFKDTGLTSATEYKYRVKAYKEYEGSVYVGERSVKTTGITKPLKVKNLKVSKTTKSSVTLKWDAVSRATGYRIYRYDAKTGTYKYYTTVTTNTFVDKNLSSKKNYQYKVAAYVSYNGERVIGLKSNAITAKTK